MAGINLNFELFNLPEKRRQQALRDQLERLAMSLPQGVRSEGPPTPGGGVPMEQDPQTAFVRDLLQPATAQQGIQSALQLLEQRRKAELAQQTQTGQQEVLSGITGTRPELGPLAALIQAYGPQAGDSLKTLVGQVTPVKKKPTTLQQNLEAFGVDLKTKEGRQTGLEILKRPAVQINQAPNLPQGTMWKDPSEPALGVMPIPGGPQDPKVKSFSDREKKLQESNAKIGQVEQSFENYRNTLRKYGVKVIPGKEKTQLGTAYTDLLLELKELYKLGVLNGPDLDLMRQVIIDPTSFQAQGIESISGTDALDSQLDMVYEKIKSARDRADLIYGAGPSPTPPLPPGFVKE